METILSHIEYLHNQLLHMFFVEYIYIYIMTGFHCEALDGLELSL